MLAVNPDTLQAVDVGLLLAGMVLLVVFGMRTAHLPRRTPLLDVRPPATGPDLLVAVGALFAFFTFPALLIIGVGWQFSEEALRDPTPAVWLRLHGADMLAKTLLAIGLAIVLWRTRVPLMPRGWRAFLRGCRLGVVGVLISFPLATVQLNAGLRLWEWVAPDAAPPAHPVLDALEEGEVGAGGLALLFAGAVVIAPVVEELFFRGVLLSALMKHLGRVWVPIVTTAVMFGFVHLPQPQAVVPLITLGVVLGYLRVRGGTVWPCIVAHALFNGRTMIYAVLAPELLRMS